MDGWMDGRTHRQAESNMLPQLFQSWGHTNLDTPRYVQWTIPFYCIKAEGRIN